MMNLKGLDWDEEALRIAGITPDHLSKLVPTTEIFQHCSPEIAIQMGIDPETPLSSAPATACCPTSASTPLKG